MPPQQPSASHQSMIKDLRLDKPQKPQKLGIPSQVMMVMVMVMVIVMVMVYVIVIAQYTRTYTIAMDSGLEYGIWVPVIAWRYHYSLAPFVSKLVNRFFFCFLSPYLDSRVKSRPVNGGGLGGAKVRARHEHKRT